MSFEETLGMLFKPGMFEVFALGMAMVVAAQFIGILIFGLLDLVCALIHRFIWPGDQSASEKEAPDALS